jgi:FkbM family methyltransferase
MKSQVNGTGLAEVLEELLAEPVAAAQVREAEAFDAAAGGARSFVVVGAGGFGQRVAEVLRANEAQAEALAFADNDEKLWGCSIDGVEVFSPQDAVRRFGAQAAFVIAIWHPQMRSPVLEVSAQFRELGYRRVVPFPALLWKHSDQLLPHYLWDLPSRLLADAPDIRRAFALLDAESKAAFVAQLRLRLRGDFEHLPPPASGSQYFPEDLFELSAEECFIDCGAYDGDTLREFLARSGGHFRRAIAFEPDPANFARLEALVRGSDGLRSRVKALPLAVGTSSAPRRFAATGAANAAATDTGKTLVACIALDEALAAEQPTFVKMDIEGAEMEALHGGARVIRAAAPFLAVCVYHRPDDLWKIPRLMHALAPEAWLALRSHRADGFDLVCYAVPPGRRRSQEP